MEGASAGQMSILETMTAAMKLYKQILHQLQSQYKLERYADDESEVNIEAHISDFLLLATLIEKSGCAQTLSNRLVNRFLEITTLYTNKFSSQPTLTLRTYMAAILVLIHEYQANHASPPIALAKTANKGVSFVGASGVILLFDNICSVLRKCVKELKQKILSSIPLAFKTLSQPYGDSISVKEREKQKRGSLAQVSILKAVEHKCKKTKDLVNTNLYVGMDVDMAYLRGLSQQINSNLKELHEHKFEANQAALNCRDQFIESYSRWRLRAKRKTTRKQKAIQYNQTSPGPKSKNEENKITQMRPSLVKTPGKMPKLLEESPYNSEACGEEEKKRKQFKNMQALTFNRQFIHLSEIKNQKIAKRPYAEVKQVLVAGDELSYYSNKYCDLPFPHSSTRTAFFMQRAAKNENLAFRKKPYIGNCRMGTEE